MLSIRNSIACFAIALCSQAFLPAAQAHTSPNAQTEIFNADNAPKKKVKLLCGASWKFDMAVLKEAMKKSMGDAPDGESEMMEEMMTMMTDMMANIRFEFAADRSFSVSGGPGDEQQSGKWEMNSKGSTLTLINEDGERTEFSITVLSKKELTLKPTQEEPQEGDPFAEIGLVFVAE